MEFRYAIPCIGPHRHVQDPLTWYTWLTISNIGCYSNANPRWHGGLWLWDAKHRQATTPLTNPLGHDGRDNSPKSTPHWKQHITAKSYLTLLIFIPTTITHQIWGSQIDTVARLRNQSRENREDSEQNRNENGKLKPHLTNQPGENREDSEQNRNENRKTLTPSHHY